MVSNKNTAMLANLVKRAKERQKDPLTPLIDEYLLVRDKSEERYFKLPIDSMEERPRPPGRISPSAIGGCKKAAVFKFIGAKGVRTVGPELQMIFDDGNIRHAKWDWMFLDMQAVLGEERFKVVNIEQDVMYPRLYIAGSLDAVVAIEGKKWVVDFKGANLFTWNDVYMRDEPKAAHVWQLLSYMKARKIRRGILIYENKNDQKFRCFVIEFDPEEWKEVKRWSSSVINYLERNRLPPRHEECEKGSKMAQDCFFSKWCYGSANVRQQEQRAYKDFPGIEEQWRRGNEIAS